MDKLLCIVYLCIVGIMLCVIYENRYIFDKMLIPIAGITGGMITGGYWICENGKCEESNRGGYATEDDCKAKCGLVASEFEEKSIKLFESKIRSPIPDDVRLAINIPDNKLIDNTTHPTESSSIISAVGGILQTIGTAIGLARPTRVLEPGSKRFDFLNFTKNADMIGKVAQANILLYIPYNNDRLNYDYVVEKIIDGRQTRSYKFLSIDSITLITKPIANIDEILVYGIKKNIIKKKDQEKFMKIYNMRMKHRKNRNDNQNIKTIIVTDPKLSYLLRAIKKDDKGVLTCDEYPYKEEKRNDVINSELIAIKIGYQKYGERIGHQIAMFINNITKNIVYIDSHLANAKYTNVIRKTVIKYFNIPVHISPYKLDDAIHKNGFILQKNDKYCQTWSVYFLIFMILNPELTVEDFIKYIAIRRQKYREILEFMYYEYYYCIRNPDELRSQAVGILPPNYLSYPDFSLSGDITDCDTLIIKLYAIFDNIKEKILNYKPLPQELISYIIQRKVILADLQKLQEKTDYNISLLEHKENTDAIDTRDLDYQYITYLEIKNKLSKVMEDCRKDILITYLETNFNEYVKDNDSYIYFSNIYIKNDYDPYDYKTSKYKQNKKLHIETDCDKLMESLHMVYINWSKEKHPIDKDPAIADNQLLNNRARILNSIQEKQIEIEEKIKNNPDANPELNHALSVLSKRLQQTMEESREDNIIKYYQEYYLKFIQSYKNSVIFSNIYINTEHKYDPYDYKTIINRECPIVGLEDDNDNEFYEEDEYEEDEYEYEEDEEEA